MTTKLWLASLAVAVSLLGAGRTFANDQKNDPVPFGALESRSADLVKKDAMNWLKTATNNDAAKLQTAETLWNRTDRSVLENLADIFALGNTQAADLLKTTRNPLVPPPVGVPALLTDTKNDAFFRANLGLAVARQLSNRRVHEEALTILGSFTPEQTIDPAAYLFHRAICEHALMKRDDATKSLERLIRDASDSPERYKSVAVLVMLDMKTWKKDLGNVARLMDNSERRLELARGGPETQKIQKEVIARLDELIKEMENKAKAQDMASKGGGKPMPGGGPPNDGSCPDGGQPGDGIIIVGGPKNTKPLDDSRIVLNGGSGKTDIAKLQKLTDGWGKMPQREREKAMQEVEDIIRGLSPEHREAFEAYFREITGSKK